MCRISRAYDDYCDSELDAFEPEPLECANCGEVCEPTDLNRHDECTTCAAESLYWVAFVGPRQVMPGLELFPALASVHQLPRRVFEPLSLRQAA